MTKGKYLTLANKKKPLKKQKIRNAEYYDMQTAFDKLYADSVSGRQFRNLVELIQRPETLCWRTEIYGKTAVAKRQAWIKRQ